MSPCFATTGTQVLMRHFNDIQVDLAAETITVGANVTMLQIRAALKPLLAASPNTPAAQAAPWQAGVPALVEAAQRTDRLLNRLLAGSYSQASGEEMLRELGVQIERVETVLQSQPEPGR